MKREISQRWVLSFADLALLLLSFFVLMQAQVADRIKLAAGLREAFGGGASTGTQHHDLSTTLVAGALFEPGEAVFRAGQIDRLRRIGADAARAGKRVLVASEGRDGANARLDAWELSAARTTAVARAIRGGGLSDAMIDIAIPPTRQDDPARGQRIAVRLLPGRD
jgi:flagellar motor protein MotB